MNTLEVVQRARPRLPRLGFIGLGWIGCQRMQSLVRAGAGEVAALIEPVPARLSHAHDVAPRAVPCTKLAELFALDLDGVVIATPSALHAEQAVQALERGLPVFCQKPLARTALETERVLSAARRADRLLGVDLSYRFTSALCHVRDAVQNRRIGEVFAADLVFHNAYGPDRSWARDPAQSGGGCVIDLGIHLVDMLLWVLDFPTAAVVSSARYAHGQPLVAGDVSVCEDFAVATLELNRTIAARLACSWDGHHGCDAIIHATFHGDRGTVALCNVNGSFLDFRAQLHHGTETVTLCEPPDDWGGRALIAWSQRLARDPRYDAAVETNARVAAVLDGMIGR